MVDLRRGSSSMSSFLTKLMIMKYFEALGMNKKNKGRVRLGVVSWDMPGYLGRQKC